MSFNYRRLLVAALFALPFIAVGFVAMASWQDPPPCLTGQTCPPDNNLLGPVWLQPMASPTAQYGTVSITQDTRQTINGVANPAYQTGGWVYADQGSFNSGITDSVYATSILQGKAAIHGVGFKDPTSADPVTGLGTWAGKFTGAGGSNQGYVLADYYCTPAAGGTYNCTGGAAGLGGGLWSLETGKNNIFKTTATGVVAIGTGVTPSTITAASGTKLLVSGTVGEFAPAADQPARITIDQNTGNPELNLKISATANDQWALYADKTTRQFRLWSQATSGGASADRLVVTSDGKVGIGDTSPASLLTVGNGDLFQVQVTGEVLVITGTAAAPAYSFTGDTNTGVYSGGADVLKFVTGGVDRVTLTSDGVTVFAGWTPQSPGGLVINPTTFYISSTTAATITGTNLGGGATTVTFSGTGVTASVLGTSTASQLNISVVVAAGAATGGRTFTVTTPTGGSTIGTNPVTVSIPAPTITSPGITPNCRVLGSTNIAGTIKGTNLNGATSVAFTTGTGVSATITNSTNPTSLAITITVTNTATIGSRAFTVTTPGGTASSGSFVFTVPSGSCISET